MSGKGKAVGRANRQGIGAWRGHETYPPAGYASALRIGAPPRDSVIRTPSGDEMLWE